MPPQGWAVVAEPVKAPTVDRSTWDLRPDGSKKGDGFLGVLRRPDGSVMSEYSIADSEQLKDAKGQYLDYPSLVPTLTRDEVSAVLNAKEGQPLPRSVYAKAEAFALERRKAGKPLFAGAGEQRLDLYPDLQRATVTNGATNTAPSGWTPVATASAAPVSEPDWIDKLTGWLPAIGGTVGGIAGGTAGSVVPGAGTAAGAVGGATLGGMAGEAYKELINRARGRRAPASATDAAVNLAKEGGIQGASEVAGMGVGAVVKPIGARIMQSAIKPGLKTLLRGGDAEIQPVVKTMLDEGVNVSSNGVKKLQTLLSATKQDVTNAIQQAGATAAAVSPLRVAGRLTATARKFAEQVNPQADLEAISQVGENFLESHGAKDLTLPAAQALKVGTYRVLRDKFGQMGAAATEAEKALARGLKEELEAHVPGISALNAREANLLQALGEVGKRAALSGNKDPIGFAWVAHNPTMFLAAVIDRNPAIKSLIARGLYNHAGQIAKVSSGLIRTAVHSLASDDRPDESDAGTSGQ